MGDEDVWRQWSRHTGTEERWDARRSIRFKPRNGRIAALERNKRE